MRAYNARILATSLSPQRIDRAQRMLRNLELSIARLRRQEDTARLARIERSAPPDQDYETVWNGGEGLCSDLIGSSLDGRVRTLRLRQ